MKAMMEFFKLYILKNAESSHNIKGEMCSNIPRPTPQSQLP